MGGPVYQNDSTNVPGSTLGLVFDGATSRISIPDNPQFQITKSLTIDAYIRLDGPAFASDSQILLRGDDRAGYNSYYLGFSPSGYLMFSVRNAANQESIICRSVSMQCSQRTALLSAGSCR